MGLLTFATGLVTLPEIFRTKVYTSICLDLQALINQILQVCSVNYKPNWLCLSKARMFIVTEKGDRV